MCWNKLLKVDAHGDSIPSYDTIFKELTYIFLSVFPLYVVRFTLFIQSCMYVCIYHITNTFARFHVYKSFLLLIHLYSF